MAGHVKVFIASLLAVPCLSMAPQILAADAGGGERTPDAAQTGTTNDKGMTTYGNKEAAGGTVVVDSKPVAGEVAPAPAPVAPVAPAPKTPTQAWSKEKPLADAPAGSRLVILDGKAVYMDWNSKVLGLAPTAGSGAAGGAPADPNAEAKRKEIRDAEAKIKLENNIRSAIRRLGTSGWREASNELASYGKPSMPFLIEAMGNVDDQDNVLPSAFQNGGHFKADTGHATRQRTLGDVCSELLTEMIKNHSTYKGELPTTSQEEWQAWWAANGETLTIGN